MEKLTFTEKTPEKILSENKTGILNFQNLYSVYLFNNEPDYKKAISSPNNFIFPDGRILSLFLGIKQVRGPSFTKYFLQNKINQNQKHFFILPEKKDLNQLIKKFPKLKNAKAYSPPYIQNTTFSKEEVSKIIKQLKQFKPDYVWICIGNPKQEILANQLYKEYPALYFNIGAATDFLLERKKELPLIFRRLGLEWLYRLITDLKYSWKKVLGSFIGLGYLNFTRKIEILKK
jgi:exopolysaccharide biosynthesis WecB/TagA/CpsF family protein